MRARRDRSQAPARRSAAGTPASGAAHSALRLQASVGNRTVTSLVQRAASPQDVDLALRKLNAVLDPDALDEPAGPAATVQRQPDGEPPKPKPGKAGDVVKAVLATPEGKQAVKAVKDKAEADIKALKPGEKAAVVSAAIAMAAPAVTAAMIQPDSRSFLLSQVSGKKVGIPGLDGVSAKVDFDKDGRPTGGMVYVNVGTFLPSSWGFK